MSFHAVARATCHPDLQTSSLFHASLAVRPMSTQVAGLFERIWEELEDDQSLVIVLIDEVESLTAARQAAMAGGEPADSIRQALPDQAGLHRTCSICPGSQLHADLCACWSERERFEGQLCTQPSSLRAWFAAGC